MEQNPQPTFSSTDQFLQQQGAVVFANIYSASNAVRNHLPFFPQENKLQILELLSSLIEQVHASVKDAMPKEQPKDG